MKKIIIAAAMLVTGTLFAQSTTWIFGNMGKMKMTNGVISAPGGSTSMAPNEGCAGVVDALNNVVMYTDGSQLFNGAGMLQASGLGGSSSSTQSAIIVPIPGQNCQSYYIFTTAAAETDYGTTNGNTGLRVSKATVSGVFPYTITIAAGEQNINLLNGANAGNLVAEKLAATSDGAGGYWVIARGVGTYGDAAFATPINIGGQNKFFAVQVTSLTNTIPALQVVTTTVANLHRSACHPYGPAGCGAFNPQYNGQGQMKFNPAGTKVALVQTYNRQVELSDFNLTTGVFNNPIYLNGALGVNDCTAYGVEFALNAPYLYVSTTYKNGNLQAQCAIYQFDISSNVANTIVASRVTVFADPSFTDYYFGAMQRGPDGKIYIARNGANALDVILYPDNTIINNNNSCGFAQAWAPISGTCLLGLPTVVVYNPCEGNNNPYAGTCPACTGTVSQTATYVIDIAGNGSINLTLNSGVPIKKMKIYIANYSIQTTTGCQSCVSANTPIYGTFNFAQTVAGTPAVLTPHTNNVTAAYSREATYSFPNAVLVNQVVGLNFNFPPALTNTGCYNRVTANIKVEFIDVNCVACEKNIFATMVSPVQGDGGGSGGEDGRMSNPDNEIQEIDKGMRAYPNPASSELNIQLINLKQEGILEIVNTLGEVVVSEKNPGENIVLDTTGLAKGIYMIRYTTGDSEYIEKLVIQ